MPQNKSFKSQFPFNRLFQNSTSEEFEDDSKNENYIQGRIWSMDSVGTAEPLALNVTFIFISNIKV